MRVYKNLEKQASKKGINCTKSEYEKICSKVSYYQLINAYKPLFAMGANSIDLTIQENLKKYKRKYPSKSNKEILKLDIIEHNYVASADIKDFYHYYKVDNELSNIFLKYTLIVEETIKSLLINYLNKNVVNSNYLTELSNYKQQKKSLNTLSKIIKKIGYEGNERPLSRKHDQGVIPPYWIIIKYLSFGETLFLIKTLKAEQEILKYINEYYKVVDLNQDITIDIEKIKNLRNHVAHNNALFLYNLDFVYSSNKVRKQRVFPKLGKNNKGKSQEQIIVNKVSWLKKQYNLSIDPNLYKEQDVSYILLLTLIFLDKNDSSSFLNEITDTLITYRVFQNSANESHEVSTNQNNLQIDDILDNLQKIKAKQKNGNINFLTELKMIERKITKMKVQVAPQSPLYTRHTSYIDFSGLSESKMQDLSKLVDQKY